MRHADVVLFYALKIASPLVHPVTQLNAALVD
jgi:hypothetical protein